jgi:hypothetical protein
LQDDGEEEDDAIRPAFVVEVAENGRVAVVVETEVQRFLSSEGDVDVLAKRDPGC